MILVAVTGMAALVAQMMRKGSNNSGVVFTSVFGLAMALATSLGTVGKDFPAQFGGMVELTPLGNAAQIIVLISAILSILISSNYLLDKKITLGEVYPLLIWATLGSLILCVSTNLLVIFIGIEILSISLYVLAGLSRGEERSEEAAMKYFLLGAFATGFLLYGIAFFYGATGSLELANFNPAWIGSKGENTVY
jgi:NADH-quinone oxidoreductase subunit N